jgi:hypothetical protein
MGHIEGRFVMSRSTEALIPLRTIVIGGYVMDDQDSVETHYNLPRESDLNFSAILKGLRAMLCLHGSETHSTAS